MVDETEMISNTILALDPDYWKCEKCGAINSAQTDGEKCWWCLAR